MPSEDALSVPIPDRVEFASLKGCARCGGDHEHMTFTKMERPIDDMPYWAPCPTNGDPILLRVAIDPAQPLPLETG